MKRILWVALAAVVLVWAGSVQAWDGHDIITHQSLRDFEQLELMLEETPYLYDDVDDSMYNLEFELVYLHADGEPFSALDVLTAYASEPDWDLDTNLQLSRLQVMTGGSHGWRHQRYALLGGVIVLGVAPERAEHFYQMALHAHAEEDLYWAFRFLARSLHYMQDMGQPYHALPMPVSHFLTRHWLNIADATIVAENLHFALEGYVEHQLAQGYLPFLEALQGSAYTEIRDVKQAAIDLNEKARGVVMEQYDLTQEVWPDLAVPHRQRLDFAYEPVTPSADLDRLHEIIEKSLRWTAKYTRGMVLRFLEDTGM